MSRLRRTGLTIDDPLSPATANDDVTSAPRRDDGLTAGSSGGPPRSMQSPKPQRSAAPRLASRQGPRATAASAASEARAAPDRAATRTPANGVWRAWSGQTRVASYRLPNELLAEHASASADLQLPVGLLVTAAIAHFLDKPADAITGLVDRADDARRAARRGLTTAPDDAEVASDEADML